MNRSDRIRIFTEEIWAWYKVHKRVLPWRDLKTKNANHRAYLILVSEVMLQQTQVSRVIVLYKKFIQKFPQIEDLSKASNREILIAWRGLGYNNRALRLRDAVKTIVEKHHGKFPREMDELQDLPGVGHYTASAIRNFAFGIPTPCIDVNIRRILHRFFVGMESPDGTWKKDDRFLLKLAREVLQVAFPPHTSGKGIRVGERNIIDWHAALMDFGALVCTKNSPKWVLFSPKMRSCCMAYGKEKVRTKKVNMIEPGREIAGRFVPNRIIRGRIIEVLRDHPKGFTRDAIGSMIAIDWPADHSLGDGRTMGDHQAWLDGILQGLQRDSLITVSRNRYCLRQ